MITPIYLENSFTIEWNTEQMEGMEHVNLFNKKIDLLEILSMNTPISLELMTQTYIAISKFSRHRLGFSMLHIDCNHVIDTLCTYIIKSVHFEVNAILPYTLKKIKSLDLQCNNIIYL